MQSEVQWMILTVWKIGVYLCPGTEWKTRRAVRAHLFTIKSELEKKPGKGRGKDNKKM